MRIAYWTTACLEPEIEAVSKELFDLAAAFRDSAILAVSPHLSFTVDRRRRLAGFHPRFTPLLRGLIPVLERSAAVNHIYAEVSPWLFFKSLRRRPIILTIASEKGDPNAEFLARCQVIVAQTQSMHDRLSRLGVERDRVRLIYPGVDLKRFGSGQRRSSRVRPKVLLATFPRAQEELGARGVCFLLEVAKKYSAIDFSLVCRPWSRGNTAERAVVQRIRDEGLQHVALLQGVQKDMQSIYQEHDFTVIPYTSVDGGKECPRSLVESLACGVPALISEVAPFAPFVREHDCGCVFEGTPEGFANALEAALSAYETISGNASRIAREFFDLSGTLREYGRIYDEVA